MLSQWRRMAVALLLVNMVACSPRPARDLTVLTRGDCPELPALRANLEAALTTLGLPLNYEVIDLDVLAEGEPGTGFPTPTGTGRGA